jgi:hypothetical protein
MEVLFYVLFTELSFLCLPLMLCYLCTFVPTTSTAILMGFVVQGMVSETGGAPRGSYLLLWGFCM